MKKIILFMFALMGMTCAVAQTVESSRFTDNWSLGVKGGVVTPVSKAPFWGDMRGLAGLELKKEVTPILGLGIEGEWSVNTSGWQRNLHSANVVDHQLVGGFLTGNLMNMVKGYKGSPRLCEVEALAGIGWLHYYETEAGDLNGWYIKFGANANFNPWKNSAWSFSFKPAIVFDMNDGLSTNFNANRAYLELQAGIVYHFKNSNGSHSFKLCDKVATQAELDELNAQINELRSRNTEAVEKVVEKVVTKEVVVDNTALNNAIGFRINSAKVPESAYASLSNVAAWLKGHPESKVIVKGYADKETGTEEYNLKLGERRAQAVKDVLVKEFGVGDDQVSIQGVGASEQVYPVNNWNRVVVFSVSK